LEGPTKKEESSDWPKIVVLIEFLENPERGALKWKKDKKMD
jgi:hypothetical protein